MILPFIIFGLLIAGMVYGYYSEKKIWNNGVAPCGTNWKNFDMDSQGGRGYNCGCGKHWTWISYWVDRKYED